MDFNILECRHFVAPNTSMASFLASQRIVCNYEFDFRVNGELTTYLDGQENKISEGSIAFRKPGQHVASKGDYDCYILTVDFSKQTPVKDYIRNTATLIEPEFDCFLLNSIPSVVKPHHSGELQNLFDKLSRQLDLNSEASHSIFKEILFLINADLQHKSFLENKPVKTIVDDAMLYINQHFHEDISLSDVANHVAIDKNYLIRLFKKQYSVTPGSYLIECRLNHARYLLANTALPINQIAEMCGYNSTTFFITQFRKNQKNTPLEYRQTVIDSN